MSERTGWNFLLLLASVSICVVAILVVDALWFPTAKGITHLRGSITALDYELPTSSLNYSLFGEDVPYQPKRCQIFDGQWVRLLPTEICTNSRGFRDYEHSVEKPENSYRIIILGDSYTFGWGVELGETVPKQLEHMLNENSSGTRYEVLNFGFPGIGLTEELYLLRRYGLGTQQGRPNLPGINFSFPLFRPESTNYSPDLVVFLFVRGDTLEDEPFRTLRETRISWLMKERNLSYSKAKMVVFGEDDTAYALDGESPDTLRSRFSPVLWELSRLAADRNFTVVFAVDSASPAEEDLLEWAATEFNFTLFKLEPQTHPDYNPLRMQLHPLDRHPTPLANRIKAELLEGWFKKVSYI